MIVIPVDYNSRVKDNEGDLVPIAAAGSPFADQLGLQLSSDGQEVILTDGEIEVTARLFYDRSTHVWYARPIWSTRRDIPASEVVRAFVTASPEKKLNIMHSEIEVQLRQIENCVADLQRYCESGTPLVEVNRAIIAIKSTIDEIRAIADILSGKLGE